MKNSKSLPVPTKTNNHVSRTSEEELNRLAKMWCELLIGQRQDTKIKQSLSVPLRLIKGKI